MIAQIGILGLRFLGLYTFLHDFFLKNIKGEECLWTFLFLGCKITFLFFFDECTIYMFFLF